MPERRGGGLAGTIAPRVRCRTHENRQIAAALTTLLAAGTALGAPSASDARVVLVDRATARATPVLADSFYSVAWASGGTSLRVSGGDGRDLVEVTRNGSATRVVRRLRGVTTFGPEGRSVENTSLAPQAFAPDGSALVLSIV